MNTRSAVLSRPSSITTVYGREASSSCAMCTPGEGVVSTANAMRNERCDDARVVVLHPQGQSNGINSIHCPRIDLLSQVRPTLAHSRP